MTDARRVQAGAGAGQRLRRQIQQCAGQGAGGRGVADAHLPADENLGARCVRPRDTGGAGGEAGLQLCFAHGWAPREIGRATAGARRDDAGVVGGFQNADIDHLQRRAELARQHIDGGPPAGEIGGHGLRDSPGKSRYTFLRHAVISREHTDPETLGPRIVASLQSGQPHRQGFETAQRSRWLRQTCLPFLRGGARAFTGGWNDGDFHRASLRICGNPAVTSTTRSQHWASA